ncbi:FkbM family methyltransferase [Microvirga calopogonii]|uniref:FkbM family methyltransferase n=1 Tax=Microvirga calopogonii TaxID=2078013 RepID=UPI000E0D42A3|nr:FkbM family methyltransferase [Microvirga calopogonii]
MLPDILGPISRRLKGTLPRKIIGPIRRKLAPESVICTMKGGYRVQLRPKADPFEMSMYINKQYEPATLNLLDHVLRPGDTMVDVGANIGLMSLHAAKRVERTGSVIALEPHPIIYDRLMSNIELNGLSNIRALQVAAGSRDEELTLFDMPAINMGSATLSPEVQASGRPVGVVKVRPLDAILSDAGVGSVRLIKIDVEGFEEQVLQGAERTLAREPIICLELGGSRIASHNLIMRTGRYDCYVFTSSKFRTSKLSKCDDVNDLMKLPEYENAVFIPHSSRQSISDDIFS